MISERLKAIQLKSQVEKHEAQKQKSLQRNQMIRRQMAEFEANLVNVSAKTQRLRTLKVRRVYHTQNPSNLAHVK